MEKPKKTQSVRQICGYVGKALGNVHMLILIAAEFFSSLWLSKAFKHFDRNNTQLVNFIKKIQKRLHGLHYKEAAFLFCGTAKLSIDSRCPIH